MAGWKRWRHDGMARNGISRRIVHVQYEDDECGYGRGGEFNEVVEVSPASGGSSYRRVDDLRKYG